MIMDRITIHQPELKKNFFFKFLSICFLDKNIRELWVRFDSNIDPLVNI